jgi:cytochrome c556
VLRSASDLLNAPGIKAAPPAFRAENPEVENEPAEIQTAVDSNRADFNAHATRLKAAADVALRSADAKDPRALMKALDGIDKACESCHLRYFYPRDKRAQQQAKEDGVD